MENKNIITILIVIILILAVMIGITVLHPFDSKKPSKVKITSNKTLAEGDGLTIKLTDLNKTPISDENVNITVKDSKGKVVANEMVKTNDKGNAKMDLKLDKGKYNVAVNYGGNKNYAGNNTSQELTIKEKVAQAQLVSSNSKSSSGSGYDINNLPPTNDPYPETNRYFIDENHVKQEYADGYMRTVDVRTGEVHSLGFK